MTALKVPGKRTEKAEPEAILRGSVIASELKNTNTQLHKDFEIELPNEGIALYGESKDGSKVAFSDYSKVWVCDFENGERLATFDRKREKEALDEFLDPIQDTEKMVRNTKGKKTESEKYTQTLGYSTLFIYDQNGNIVRYFDADKTAKWVYSQDDSFIVVYTGDENNYTYIYSFNEDIFIQLEDKHMYVSEMWLSENGRYIFIQYATKHMDFYMHTRYIDVYDTASGSYITTFTDDSRTSIGDRLVFSDIFYMFPSSKAVKYVFEDTKPDFSDVYISEKGNAVKPSNSENDDIKISADGKRLLTVNSRYISKKVHEEGESVTILNISDVESGKTLLFF